MNYTQEQFQALAPYADNFRTAIEGEWSRRIPVDGQKLIRKTYEDATKTRIPFNSGCQLCLLNLLKRAGRLWFADKKEIEAAQAAPKIDVPGFEDVHVHEGNAPAEPEQAPAQEAPAPEAPQDGAEKGQKSTRKPGKGNGTRKTNNGRKSAPKSSMKK